MLFLLIFVQKSFMIKKIVKKRIGKEIHTFQVEGENFQDVVMESKKLSFGNVVKCGLCGSDNLELSAHIAKKKFKYVNIICRNCKAYLNFGQQQEDNTIYYLKTKSALDERGKVIFENGKEKKVLDWRPFDSPDDNLS